MGASSPFLYIIQRNNLSCQCVVFWSLSLKSDNIQVKVKSEANVKGFFYYFAAGSPVPLFPLAAAAAEEASGWGITRGEASTTWVYKTNIFLNINSKVQLTNKQHWTQVWDPFFCQKCPYCPNKNKLCKLFLYLCGRFAFFTNSPPPPTPGRPPPPRRKRRRRRRRRRLPPLPQPRRPQRHRRAVRPHPVGPARLPVPGAKLQGPHWRWTEEKNPCFWGICEDIS